MTVGVAPAFELEFRNSAFRCACASCSEAGIEALRERSRFFNASLRAVEDACALDRGRLSAVSAPSSKQTVHEAGSPSVTIKGVGPWRSQ